MREMGKQRKLEKFGNGEIEKGMGNRENRLNGEIREAEKVGKMEKRR